MPTEEEIAAQKKADDEARAKALKTEVHAAVASHLKDLRPKLAEDLKGILGETLKGLTTELDTALESKLDAKLAAFKPAGAGAGDGAGAGAKPPSVQDTPEFRGMVKKQAELEAAVQRAEAARNAERTKSRDAAMRTRVSDGLLKRGIDPARVPHALGYLVDVKKLAKYAGDDDDSDIVIRDAGGEEVDFDSGLDSWAKSDDLKIYLPPRGAAGSGDRGGGRRPGAATKKEADYADVGEFVLGAFPSMGTPGRR
jgi:hypothetical protein